MKNQLITVGVIAERTGIPVHTVQYLIQSRNIQPESRAGRLRVFGETTIEKIQKEYDASHNKEVACA